MNAGIIVAGGTGRRFGGYKQAAILNNKPIYQYSIDVFNQSNVIGVIFLVIPKDLQQQTLQETSSMRMGFHPSIKLNIPIYLCYGGNTRSESVYNAIKKIDKYSEERSKTEGAAGNVDIVVIHDAVRPLIQSKNIVNVVNACYTNDGAILAHPVSDTLKKVQKNTASFTIDRNNLWLAETPQAFKFKQLKNCYKNINKDDRSTFTDEASLMEHCGYTVQVLHNKVQNIKITEKEDLALLNSVVRKSTTGIGLDFHSLVEGEHLVVGGHKIDCQFSSKAHSDGDVLTHSIIDALLGALGLGDIGEHFPNTPENFNISSIELLEKIVQKIPNNKKILHIDSSIVLNDPKISPHKKEIKKSLSSVLGVGVDKISIKSTTTNGLAFLNMSTGWGAQTILTLGDDS